MERCFWIIGRNEYCALRLDLLNERIAFKQPAYIEAKPDGFYLTDNQSTNGTLLNGQRFKSSNSIPATLCSSAKTVSKSSSSSKSKNLLAS
ncbi:MAG: FHA domain-containing protein [Pyrinomonadaceae bacterium]|nr:FHA domain-containing protein [Pyrinomonadaceae bacterium]